MYGLHSKYFITKHLVLRTLTQIPFSILRTLAILNTLLYIFYLIINFNVYFTSNLVKYTTSLYFLNHTANFATLNELLIYLYNYNLLGIRLHNFNVYLPGPRFHKL